MMPETFGPIEYVMSRLERRIAEVRWRGRVGQAAMLIGFVLWLCVAVFSTFNSLRQPAQSGIPHWLVPAGFGATLTLLAIRGVREWRRVERYTITFGARDIAYRIDDVPSTIEWFAIGHALAAPGGFVLVRRDDPRPLMIPRRAFADGGHAFWSFMEFALTGTAPTLRELGVPPPNTLTNTVDYRLIARRSLA